MLNLYKILATSLGAGYSPFAPGTAGAAVGVLAILGLHQVPQFQNDQSFFILLLGLTVLFFFVGVHCTNKLEPLWGKDPQRIVLDETIGVWIGMLGLPVTWPWLLAAFVLFRFFDIAKPLGIRKMENFPGGWGVMLDDVLAGVYTLIVLQVVYQLWF